MVKVVLQETTDNLSFKVWQGIKKEDLWKKRGKFQENLLKALYERNLSSKM